MSETTRSWSIAAFVVICALATVTAIVWLLFFSEAAKTIEPILEKIRRPFIVSPATCDAMYPDDSVKLADCKKGAVPAGQ